MSAAIIIWYLVSALVATLPSIRQHDQSDHCTSVDAMRKYGNSKMSLRVGSIPCEYTYNKYGGRQSLAVGFR